MPALGLNYMGTKRALAPQIASVIAGTRSGPVLDGFSGMCAVGQAVGPARPVWSNDVQVFAATVARALFVYPDHPPRCSVVPEMLFEDFRRNRQRLEREHERLVRDEDLALAHHDARRLSSVTERSRRLLSNDSFRRRLPGLRREPHTFPYRLFTYYYSGTYLGLRQCIDADSLIFAIHTASNRNAITKGQESWLLIALATALQRVATTTGHFAQYLQLKTGTSDRYMRQRRRVLWDEWLDSIPTESPIGSWDWRAQNRAYAGDVLQLLRSLRRGRNVPAVVYADPPYTTDHYSRYYHVLETLVKYDYPKVASNARYRVDRFQTPFSIKSQAAKAFRSLAAATARIGADLVVSYPEEGLLSELHLTPVELLKPYFRSVEISERICHIHSTHGASKGPAKRAVTEIIYWARP